MGCINAHAYSVHAHAHKFDKRACMCILQTSTCTVWQQHSKANVANYVTNTCQSSIHMCSSKQKSLKLHNCHTSKDRLAVLKGTCWKHQILTIQWAIKQHSHIKLQSAPLGLPSATTPSPESSITLVITAASNRLLPMDLSLVVFQTSQVAVTTSSILHHHGTQRWRSSRERGPGGHSP